ncbi:MAG: IS91 family transposase [Lachnospiraceae bacterium]|nr:IS91 family transposase [Lachnospiraceae bacterium]
MSRSKIQQIFDYSWNDYLFNHNLSSEQERVGYSIMNCKTKKMGYNVSTCSDCGHTEIHNNSCRIRNCPNCQAVLKEVWIDSRKSEVIDTSYYHVIFTVPAELRPIIYTNQELLYSLLHKCSAESVLELSKDDKYLGAIPGIIQVLHTWGQDLHFHPHIHSIISGGGLSKNLKLKKSRDSFFIPVNVLQTKYRKKFLILLDKLHKSGKLIIPDKCKKLRNSYEWNEFRDKLYNTHWNVHIKETFNGFGNAIEYLGRYTHRIAITNSRIISVTKTDVSFRTHNYRTGEDEIITISHEEFIRRFMLHILPSGFQKIRYYGFLNNRSKKKNLQIIFSIQRHQRYTSMLTGLSMDEILKKVWNYNIHICPCCGKSTMMNTGRVFPMRC